MNSVDINFSEFGPPIKLIIIDPKKYKSRFKKPTQAKSGRTVAATGQQKPQYSAFERLHSNQHQYHYHKVPNNIPRTVHRQPQSQSHNSVTDKPSKAKPTETNAVRIPAADSSAAVPSTTSAATPTNPTDKSVDEPVFIEDEDIFEEEDQQLQSFLTTEQTTRAGRVSKKTKLFSASANAPLSGSSIGPANADGSTGGEGANAAPPKPKVKKRKPAEAFRCKTCSKYYVGHTKLRLHYKKNPDHKIPQKKQGEGETEPSTSTTTSNTSKEPSISNLTSASTCPCPEVVILKACTSVGVQANLHSHSHAHSRQRERATPSPLLLLSDQLPSSTTVPVTHPLTLEISSDCDCESSASRRRMLEPITVPMTSGNVMSPGENSMNAAMTTLTLSMAVGGEIEFPCRAVANSNLAGKSSSLIDNAVEENEGAATEMDEEAVDIDKEIDGDADADAAGGRSISQTAEAPKSASKPIWEFVDEKLTREGINQVLAEISDVAEKLSKIARDKIIPIREEEEERLQSSVPIIQVDNPFLSHLLDLPFGTYIFKDDDEEDDDGDGPRRRGGALSPPPSITELSQFSLTGGAEVDIDKFLTPDSVARPLPHLTNLDFNAICSNNGSNSNQ